MTDEALPELRTKPRTAFTRRDTGLVRPRIGFDIANLRGH